VSCKCIMCTYWTEKENTSGIEPYGSEDATWEHEDAMRAKYPHLFEDFENLVDVV
jgi:hypothetical protein